MEKIDAWVYNPDNAIFKGASKRAALFTIYCTDPNKCDLHKNCNTCRLTSAFTGCKFGKKTESEGFTRRAIKFHSWISDAKKDNTDVIDKLDSYKYSGIFKAHGHYCLPYSHMKGSKSQGFPIQDVWIPESEMDAGVIRAICEAKPRYLWGNGLVTEYQSETLPRFLHDLKTHYPELLSLVPDEHREKVQNINFVGRQADITTCNPSRYKMGTNHWEWDGKKLIGSSMLFQPAKGKIRIEIEPDAGQRVKITDNSQVNENTVFLD